MSVWYFIKPTDCVFDLSSACGGTLTGTGQLRSPYHPNVYPHNKECEWVINQQEGYVVTLNFLSFDVEGGSCHFDFVEVNENSTNFFGQLYFLISVLLSVPRTGFFGIHACQTADFILSHFCGISDATGSFLFTL